MLCGYSWEVCPFLIKNKGGVHWGDVEVMKGGSGRKGGRGNTVQDLK